VGSEYLVCAHDGNFSSALRERRTDARAKRSEILGSFASLTAQDDT
jgi:hypothetical protein